MQRGEHEELAEGWEGDVDLGVVAVDTTRKKERESNWEGIASVSSLEPTATNNGELRFASALC